MPREAARRPVRRAVAILGGVVAISLLHYSVSVHIVILHEVFRRLYYIPIVTAAVLYGTRAAVGTSLVASVLYLPHVVVAWQGWPLVEVSQYGELILFNLVALVTGALADRLRAERNRHQEAAEALRKAYAALEARAEERLQVDRFVTIGRLAAGFADQVRNPLAALTGCLEIVGGGVPHGHPKAEFIEVARKEIARLDGLVRDFLEFARPAAPAPRRVDLRAVLGTTARLAQSVLSDRHLTLDLGGGDSSLVVEVDEEQVKRALFNLVLESAAMSGRDAVKLVAKSEQGAAVVRIETEAGPVAAAGDPCQPVLPTAPGRLLALAMASRLIENQRGSLRVERRDRVLCCLVRFPLAAFECASDREVMTEGT